MNKVLPIILMLGLISVGATAQQTVGGGGDELRFLFNDGRNDAIEKIAALRRCSFQSNVPEEVKDWILKNRYPLISDIAQSIHTWITDYQATCAYTQLVPNSPIILSFVRCSTIQSQTEAGRLLVHETVHHLGKSDEAFADNVAVAIYTASNTTSCPSPTDDPFDPLSCTGDPADLKDLAKHFKVGEFRTQLSNFSMHGRERSCHQMLGCTAWRGVPIVGKGNVAMEGHSYSWSMGVNQSGTVNLNLQPSSIFVDLDFGSSDFCSDPFGTGSLYSPCRDKKGPFKLNPILGAVNEYSTKLETNFKPKNWNPHAPGISGALIGDISVVFDQGVMTDHCLKIYNSKSRVSAPDSQGYWTERQGVVLSRYKRYFR